MVDPSIRSRVEQARVVEVFERNLAPTLLNIPFALVVALVLWRIAPHPMVIWWTGLKVATAFGRILLLLAHRRAKRPVAPGPWTRRQAMVLAIDGLVWGLLGVWFTPRDAGLYALPMLGVVLGLFAVGAHLAATHLMLAASFQLPLIVPSAIHQLAQGDLLGLFLFLSMLTLLGLVLHDGKRAEQSHIELLTLRFQVAEEAEARAVALEEARRHSAVKSQFLATMSHEMRTPLHGILGTARLLREGLIDPARVEQADLIVRSGEHLLGVINDVLDFSRIDAGRLSIREEPFDLSRTVREAVALFVGAAEEHGLKLHLDDQLGDLGPQLGDAARVRQVVMNLVGNAVKFTERGEVRVTARRSGERAEIRVADTGQGIAASDLPLIFDAFRQADSTFSRRHPGSGLGLTISRELAQAMGGTLTGESVIGEGSTFTLSLPLLRAAPGSLAPPAPDLRRRLRGEVILVEDHEVNVLVARALLDRLGVSVRVATDAAAGLALFEAGAPDAVLMDLHLPGVDGFEASRTIRGIERTRGRARTPIIAVTAAVSAEEQERCRAAGMDAFLSKPFGEAELYAALSRFLEPSSDEKAAGAIRRAGGDPASEDDPLADRAAAVARLGGFEDLYQSVIADFVQHAPALIASLSTAVAASRPEARRHAHTLKGLAGTVGAPRLQQAARTLELALATDGTQADVGPLLASCERELSRISAAVTAAPSTPRPTTGEATG